MTTHYLITQVFDVRGFLASHSSNNTKAAATTTTTTTTDNAATSNSTVSASNDGNSDSITTSSSTGIKNSGYYPLVDGKVYHFDEVLGAMVMQYIEEPHIILRKGLIASQKHSTLASDMATFAANTLFYTSGLHLPAPEFRQQVANWIKDINRWTSPQLDDTVTAIRNDVDLKLAISLLKEKFLQSTEALIHGDLHTGSIMQFVALWTDGAINTGDAYPRCHFDTDTTALQRVQSEYMQRLLHDSLGFAGAKMIRRIIGISHVEDLECISDATTRASCERHALRIAIKLVKDAATFTDIAQVTALARNIKQQ
eukprot:12060-Heterococcus_DN1.PRE.1